jgi:hypothetical protein
LFVFVQKIIGADAISVLIASLLSCLLRVLSLNVRNERHRLLEAIMRPLSLFALLMVASPVHSASAVEIGIYAGAGCSAMAELKSYQAWLGAPAAHATENFDQSSWAAFASDVPWSVGCFATVRNSLTMTFSVPMLPADGISTLAKGASGAYDAYFTAIAQSLVSGGFSTAVVRVGWEFNGNWQPWSSYKDPASFITYFQRIVTLMKAVPGARFLIEWCPNIGTGSFAPDQSYPGDNYVDVIGMDVYDAHWNQYDADPIARWNTYVTEPYGLQWQVGFAALHMKRMSLPEWGCCGRNAGDDPYFVTHMGQWLTVNSYLYADYWDSNAGGYQGQLSQGQYPLAGAAYMSAFR